jgi:hypothetical protein
VRYRKMVEGMNDMFSAKDVTNKLKDLGTSF